MTPATWGLIAERARDLEAALNDAGLIRANLQARLEQEPAPEAA